ncbi:MAG: ACT domain-containing protein [Planctomycetota bacterium]
MTSLILTVIGPDRPGLVDALSRAIKQHDANWLESRLAQLAGQFAGIVHVRVEEGAADALTADLVNLQSRGLSVSVTRSVEPAPGVGQSVAVDRDAGRHTFQLELLGHDRPGIVRDLASALAARSINVAQLDTEAVSAPMSGEAMFKAVATLHAPADADTDELHDALDHLADGLDLDLSLTPTPART